MRFRDCFFEIYVIECCFDFRLGYMNLGDGPNTMRSRFSSLSDEKHNQIKEEPIPVISSIPKCWKTVYYLLDLYATMPETKTVNHR